MFCPRCGRQLNEGDIFCNNCGFDLRSNTEVNNIREQNAPMANSNQIQNNSQTGINYNFPNQNEQENTIKKEKNKKLIVGVIVSIVAFIIVLMIIFAILNKKKDDKIIGNNPNTPIVKDSNDASTEPFLLSVEDVYVTDNKPSVTGRIKRGQVKINDTVQIIGYNEEAISAKVIDIKTYRAVLNSAKEGDNVTIVLDGVKLEELKRGQVIVKPNSIKGYKKFKAKMNFLSVEEGGRRTPFYTNTQQQFYIRTTDFLGVMTFPVGIEEVNSGEKDFEIIVELNDVVALEEGTEISLRENGMTRAKGVVIEVVGTFNNVSSSNNDENTSNNNEVSSDNNGGNASNNNGISSNGSSSKTSFKPSENLYAYIDGVKYDLNNLTYAKFLENGWHFVESSVADEVLQGKKNNKYTQPVTVKLVNDNYNKLGSLDVTFYNNNDDDKKIVDTNIFGVGYSGMISLDLKYQILDNLPSIQLPGNLKLGSSKEDVIQAIGKPNDSDDYMFTYGNDYMTGYYIFKFCDEGLGSFKFYQGINN